MKKIASALLLFAAISAPAFAANEGGYINLDLGTVSFSNATSQFGGTNFGNPGSFTFGGGYHFNQNVAVEVGYSVIGDSTILTPTVYGNITETAKTSSFQVAAVGTLPVSEMFDLYGKLGIANTKIDYTAAPPAGYVFLPGFGTVTSATGSSTNLMYGIGGQFNINRNFGIRLQYLDLGNVQLSNGAPNVGVKITSIGGGFNF